MKVFHKQRIVMTARPDPSARRIFFSGLVSLAALTAVLIIGTVGYRIIGGPQYSWVDCFYMTFITVATIGYGEIVDLSHSPAGRIFTVFVALGGIGVTTYIMSTIVAYIVEGNVNAVLWRRRMEKRIHKLNNHYIVCGVGRVGRNVANELAATRRPFVVIDESQENIQAFLERTPDTMHLHGDATDDDVLLNANLAAAAGVFAVTGDDSRNLLITITAKQLNPAVRVVARCHEVRNIDKIRKAGADEIVSPDFTGGLRIASAMLRPHVVNFLDEMLKSDDNMRVEEVIVPTNFPATAISDLQLKSREFMLLAVREEANWRFNPDGQTQVRGGTALIVMSTPAGRTQLERMVGWV